jgi:hypothetical protein
VQLSEYNKKAPKDPNKNDVDPGYVAFMFGAVGLVVYSLLPHGGHGKGVDYKENVQAAWRKVETPPEFRNQQDLKAILERGRKILLYPKKSITYIYYHQEKGLEIHTSDRSNEKVFFGLREEVYKYLESKIKDYLLCR